MQYAHKNSAIVPILFTGLWLAICLIAPVLAEEPSWRDVPQRLKAEDGVQRQGEFLYATGMAKPAVSVRPDKTHEVARKKSLLRALQMVHMGSSCRKLFVGLKQNEQRQCMQLFAPLLPATRVEGLTIIRQWEKERAHFTTVAAPIAGLKDLPCEFPDLLAAISNYGHFRHVSLEGLAFCLRHAPRYSGLSRKIRKRISLTLQKKKLNELAFCFLYDENELPGNSLVEVLSLQNRYHRAQKFVLQAERLAKKGEWDDAAAHASQALDLLPTYGPAYLLFSDFFLHVLKMPSFALCAAEKALRDGTLLSEALERIVTSLEEINSPEKEVYKFLLSQIERGKEKWGPFTWSSAWPASWKWELKRFADNPIQNLVIFSLGQAIAGDTKPPGAEFKQAAALFGKAGNDEDVERVLDLLLEACEKQPASAKTYNLIGACYRQLGKPSPALPFLWQALALKPEYDYALTNLGLCCQSLGLMRSARFYFEQEAVKNSPSSWVQECYAKFQGTTK